jgi:hypothetical protein
LRVERFAFVFGEAGRPFDGAYIGATGEKLSSKSEAGGRENDIESDGRLFVRREKRRKSVK